MSTTLNLHNSQRLVFTSFSGQKGHANLGDHCSAKSQERRNLCRIVSERKLAEVFELKEWEIFRVL
jgi:hypothetical protein